MHNEICKQFFPSCLCMTCKKDSDSCCYEHNANAKGCIRVCEDYEKEDE